MVIVGGQAATDGVGTDGSLLCSSGMTSRLSCNGESVLQVLAQNKAICPSWFLDNRGMASLNRGKGSQKI